MAERLPPQNVNAEQSVLGSLLIDKEAISKVSDFLKPESFYKEAHALIYEAILQLFQKNDPIDLVTVSAQLEGMKKLEAVGGRLYISDLINAVPTSANVEYYGHLVEDKAILRHLISAGSQMVTNAFDEEREIDQILESTEKSIFEITQRKIRQGFVPLKEILDQVMDQFEANYDQANGTTGIPTGFVDLDTMTGGMQPSDLVILAARPSMGKTALALNLAQNMAFKGKVPTAVFSLEMSKESLVMRMLCSEAEIDSARLRSKNLQDHEWKKLARALGRLAETPIFIDDTPAINSIELRAKARRMKMEHNIGLIVIDFLQLMSGSGKRGFENRTQEVSEITRAIKSIARELKVPVICLSQLSRAVEQRQSQIPRLSDLRESGEIEQVADLVMFIHREDYYDRSLDNGNVAELIIAKQRNGPTGSVQLTFRKEITKFVNLERQTVPAS
jgi:replicative DNA helicase